MMHRILRSIPLALLTLTVPAVASAAAAEPASVKVDLSDKGGKDRILLSTNKVKAGEVEFEIANSSKVSLHEFLIAPWKGAITKLPYNDKKGAVIEAKMRQLQGVEDMKPGPEATLRLSLKPGPYVVFCNQPGQLQARHGGALHGDRAGHGEEHGEERSEAQAHSYRALPPTVIHRLFTAPLFIAPMDCD